MLTIDYNVAVYILDKAPVSVQLTLMTLDGNFLNEIDLGAAWKLKD